MLRRMEEFFERLLFSVEYFIFKHHWSVTVSTFIFSLSVSLTITHLSSEDEVFMCSPTSNHRAVFGSHSFPFFLYTAVHLLQKLHKMLPLRRRTHTNICTHRKDERRTITFRCIYINTHCNANYFWYIHTICLTHICHAMFSLRHIHCSYVHTHKSFDVFRQSISHRRA